MTGNSAWVRIGKSVGVDDGKGRNSGDDLGDSGPSLGADSPGDPGYGPTQEYGAQTRRPQADAGRHHLPDAQWLPVEPSAPGTGRRQHYSPDLPALGGAWSAGGHLGCSGGGLRRTGRSGLGMAVGGLLHGQGSFGGAPLDATPPTGAKRGARRASWSTRRADP